VTIELPLGAGNDLQGSAARIAYTVRAEAEEAAR
jgi:hypothetical protein